MNSMKTYYMFVLQTGQEHWRFFGSMIFYHVFPINSHNNFTWFGKKPENYHTICVLDVLLRNLVKNTRHAYQLNILHGTTQCTIQKHRKIHLRCFLHKHVEKLCISHSNVISHV